MDDRTYLEEGVGEHACRVGDMTGLMNLLEVEFLGEVSPQDLREHRLGEIDELASLEVGHHVGVIRVLQEDKAKEGEVSFRLDRAHQRDQSIGVARAKTK